MNISEKKFAEELFNAMRDTMATHELPGDWDFTWISLSHSEQKVFLETVRLLKSRIGTTHLTIN